MARGSFGTAVRRRRYADASSGAVMAAVAAAAAAAGSTGSSGGNRTTEAMGFLGSSQENPTKLICGRFCSVEAKQPEQAGSIGPEGHAERRRSILARSGLPCLTARRAATQPTKVSRGQDKSKAIVHSCIGTTLNFNCCKTTY